MSICCKGMESYSYRTLGKLGYVWHKEPLPLTISRLGSDNGYRVGRTVS